MQAAADEYRRAKAAVKAELDRVNELLEQVRRRRKGTDQSACGWWFAHFELLFFSYLFAFRTAQKRY